MVYFPCCCEPTYLFAGLANELVSGHHSPPELVPVCAIPSFVAIPSLRIITPSMPLRALALWVYAPALTAIYRRCLRH